MADRVRVKEDSKTTPRFVLGATGMVSLGQGRVGRLDLGESACACLCCFQSNSEPSYRKKSKDENRKEGNPMFKAKEGIIKGNRTLGRNKEGEQEKGKRLSRRL